MHDVVPYSNNITVLREALGTWITKCAADLVKADMVRVYWISEGHILNDLGDDMLEALLPMGWDAQRVYDHHEVMMLHGQRCCFFERPACERCPVREICDFYKAQQSHSQQSSGQPAKAAERDA